MTQEEFNKINALESTHWWYLGTREISINILKKFLRVDANLKILDVGCGTGGNLKELAKIGSAQGCDIDPYVVELSRANGLDCYISDMRTLSLPPNSLDLVTFYDVLNQVSYKEAITVLKKINTALKPGGIITFREPALDVARGLHDQEVNIQFRLNKDSANELLTQANFEPLYVGYINFLLFIPIIIKRRYDKLVLNTPKSDVYVHSPVINGIFLAILRLENFLLRFINFPFGISIIAVAKKTDSSI